jgi:hypothetical protein
MAGAPAALQYLFGRGLVSESLVEPLQAIAQETNLSLPEVVEALLHAGLLVLEAERTGAEVVVRDGAREMTVRVRLPIRARSRLAHETFANRVWTEL